MKVGVLTSSRADFGIYTPLLSDLKRNNFFDLEILAFGTHLSDQHGMTIQEIESYDFKTIHKIETRIEDTDSHAIALAYADVVRVFSNFWNNHSFDIVLCLGDRYEMSAAVQAGIPYNIRFAHFHGGETTLGAIDNIYRHQITLASQYHFTSTEAYADRVKELIEGNKEDRVLNTGSLSLSKLKDEPIIDRKQLCEEFGLPDRPYILGTFHPETVNLDDNHHFVNEMIASFDAIPDTHHLIITMPNADTNGKVYRNGLELYKENNPNRITLIESFGKKYYFSALKHAAFVIGNSSSAIIEAASFNQFVINVGNRQEGRLQSENTFNCKFNREDLKQLTNRLTTESNSYSGENIYVRNDTIELVSNTLIKIGNGEL